jgi:hypothetical protein
MNKLMADSVVFAIIIILFVCILVGCFISECCLCVCDDDILINENDATISQIHEETNHIEL